MSEYNYAYMHVSPVDIQDMCDADFRKTGLSAGWTGSFLVTPDGVIYRYG